MNKSLRSTFEQCALASGLLTEQQIDEARAGIGWSNGDQPDTNAKLTDEQLADRLVKMGRLNVWQARQLLDGRTKFTLGAYRITDSLGQGGMGQVFKAEHGIMGRVVAVKVLPLSKTTPDAVANFTHEIRALASLDHRRLVRALDAGRDGNVYYLVTEYVSGGDLRKLVRREGRLSMEAAASITYQVAEGLEYAHRKGLIHRDVKPGNVLLTPEGEAKLSDLGLAGPLEGNAENDPRYGKIVGTADYVSPDHVNSPWDPTPAWDIYSLGCTLYYAVTGKVPFPGGTAADKARAHCELRPLDPRRLNKSLADDFVDVLADMLAKNPDERIRSAAEVMSRLEPWVDDSLRNVSARKGPTRDTNSVETPVVAPPESQPPIIAAPQKPGGTPLAKRQSSFGEAETGFPEVPPSAAEEDQSKPTSILLAAVLCVLIPLVLAAVVMLLWWLIPR